MCNSKSTRVLALSTSGTVSKHCRMTNKKLWIKHVFKGRFLNKSFTGNTKKIKANLNVKEKKKSCNQGLKLFCVLLQ